MWPVGIHASEVDMMIEQGDPDLFHKRGSSPYVR